jgi:hypothetical protein
MMVKCTTIFSKPTVCMLAMKFVLIFLGSESVGSRETGSGSCRHDIENTSQIGAK